MLLARTWPSIGPLTVWDLEVNDWARFARAVDQEQAELEAAYRRRRQQQLRARRR